MQTTRKRFLMLVKFFSRKRHADKMLAGELRARRLKKFREIEDVVRLDKYEGTMLWEGGTISVQSDDGEWLTVPPDDLAGPIERRSPLIDNLNVFCMTAFRSDLGPWPSWELVDQVKQQVVESLPTCSRMGEHAVVIADVKEFLARVTRAVAREHWQHHSARVKYYDSYPADVAFGDGRSFMPAFLKRREYEAEREFRIALNTGTVGDDPVTLDVGDIHDIGWYTETPELADLKCRMRGICPLCGNHPCESYGMRSDERFTDGRREFSELHDLTCEKCGSFYLTGKAGELLEQRGTSGIVALGLVPRWNQLVERHVVDASLVEEAVSERRAIT